MFLVTFERSPDDLDDLGGSGKCGSAPVVSVTGGSGLAGGVA